MYIRNNGNINDISYATDFKENRIVNKTMHNYQGYQKVSWITRISVIYGISGISRISEIPGSAGIPF